MSKHSQTFRDADCIKSGSVVYIKFDLLSRYDKYINHFCSSRLGGVSKAPYESLNLGFKSDDSWANVKENFRLICDETGIDYKSLAFARQVHGINIKVIEEQDKGQAYVIPAVKDGYDGIVTDIPGITLVTFSADCVPIFLYDPVNNAVGLIHSGWKGTLEDISGEGIKKMSEQFGSNPGDIVAVIGPSIRSCCFEVKEDVYSLFEQRYPLGNFCRKISVNKWSVDLQTIIKISLIQHGLSDLNISDSGICTKCNSDMFFSYRGDGGETGSLAQFIQVRDMDERCGV